MRRILLGVTIVGVFFCATSRAGGPRKTIQAVRVDNPPEVDGNLDDPEWALAPASLDFTQYDPDEGALPTEVTSVRLLYDNSTLYVGVICYDSHPRLIVPQLTRRDRTSEADRFSVIIDSYHDYQTAFLFSANVSGVQSDGVLSQDGMVYDNSWDAVWTVRTRWYRDGWSAEFAIPFNTLRFAEKRGRAYDWGINFRRYISRKREVDEWVMVPRNEVPPGSISPVSPIGILTGLKDIDPPLQLALNPYISGKSRNTPSQLGGEGTPAYTGAGGLDIRYGVTRDFMLNATLNPDFGQVEVDQAVLNLTVFETQFPEKRPFFVEGAPLFSFGASIDNDPLNLFFSRRIGKQPSGSGSVIAPPGGAVTENPLVTPIIGAAKLTGRSSGGFSLGIISAATAPVRAELADSDGHRHTVLTEPRGEYGVVRWKNDFGQRSWFGGMATLASREFRRPALSGGFDWNVRADDGAFAIDGYVAGARASTPGDATGGAAGKLLVSRIAADHWLYVGSFTFFSKAFNCNDVGFFAQPHDEGGYVQLIYRENFAQGLVRRYFLSVVPEARWNWDGIRTKAKLESIIQLELPGFWWIYLTHDYSPQSYDDAETGIVGIYRRPATNDFQLQLTSDSRQHVWGTASAGYEFDGPGRRTFSSSLSLSVRPASWLELDPALSYRRSRKEQAWLFPDGNIVDTAIGPGAFSVFGRRSLDELNFAMRGTVTFTRTVSLQFFGQVLLDRGKYDSFSRLDGTGQLRAYDYAAFAGYSNHDFNEATLRANALLRWECLPGSAVYLVWTQERYGNSGFFPTSLGSRFNDAWSLPHEDVFFLKFSYWLPL